MSAKIVDRVLTKLSQPVLLRLEKVAARLEKLTNQVARQAEGVAELRLSVRELDTRLRALEKQSESVGSRVQSLEPLAADVGRALRRFDALRATISSTSRSLDEISRATGSRGLGGRTVVIARDVRALLRRAVLDPSSLPFPERLMSARANLTSQNEGDGILLALLDAAGIKGQQFVDIGSGISGGATSVLARELGWGGLMIDGNPEHVTVTASRFNPHRVTTVNAFVSAENINELVAGSIDPTAVAVLAIDIDGMDYWVLKALTVCRPAVVITEFNAHFGYERAVTVPYDPEFRRSNFPGQLRKQYLGASLPAFMSLLRPRGYRLVAVDQPGLNAFFVRDDVAPEVPECTLEALPYLKSETHRYSDVFEAVRDAGLPLVDVDANP